MSKQAFYNGILYTVEYQPQLSDNYYTQHKVYHMKTEDENYPSMSNALHVYYEFSYNEELDVYVYIFVRPYND